MKNKVVIVTGAASGIGLACARRFAEDGAKVVIADISESGGEKIAKDLTEEEHEAVFVHCNVAQRFDVRNLVAKAVDAYGRIDVLVNNAAILDSSPFLDLAEKDFDNVVDVNLKGYFLTGQAVARQMVKQMEEAAKGQAGTDSKTSPGAIINMSSVNAIFALPDHVAYSVTKGGVAQLTRAMAVALAEHGIRVNAIGPGSIQTPLLDKVAEDESARKRVLSRTPMGRFGKPEEIAAIAVFLASDESSYITGQTIYADGGRLPLNYTVRVK